MRFLVVLLLSGLALFAQTDAARLSGTVTDSTGAVIPGATISVLNERTGQSREVVTSPTGTFLLNNLAPSTYTVTAIHVVLPMTGGRVTAISAGSITVERRGGATQVIATTSATDYKVGEADGARSDVVVGARITAVGEESGSTFTASTVWVQPARVGSTVTKVTSSAITIERRDGKAVVVHVDGDTKVRVRGKGEAKVGDIKVGDRLEARGQLRADGSLDANRVQARTPRAKAKPTPTAAP